MKTYQKIIREICQELNIEFNLLSKDFIIKLEKDGLVKYIYGYKFPLNDHALGLILDDKYATYEILNDYNLPTIEMIPVFLNYNQEELKNYLKKYQTLIVKANNGTCGTEVYKVNTEAKLFSTVNNLLTKNAPVCLSPFYNVINEYRVIILNNQVKIMYGKIKPTIIGDGKHTIKELLLTFNYNYYSHSKNLENLNFDLKKIPKFQEKIEISYKFNLSNGSIIFEIEDLKLRNELKELALKTVKLLNIKFASVDIIKTIDNKLLILEINSGVMMDNFIKLHKSGSLIAKEVYKTAINNLFVSNS